MPESQVGQENCPEVWSFWTHFLSKLALCTLIWSSVTSPKHVCITYRPLVHACALAHLCTRIFIHMDSVSDLHTLVHTHTCITCAHRHLHVHTWCVYTHWHTMMRLYAHPNTPGVLLGNVRVSASMSLAARRGWAGGEEPHPPL